MDLLYAFIDQVAAEMSDEKGASERGRGSRLMVRGRAAAPAQSCQLTSGLRIHERDLLSALMGGQETPEGGTPDTRVDQKAAHTHTHARTHASARRGQ